MVEIVKKDREYVIINKPIGVPSQPDPTGDPDALGMTSELLRSMDERAELWLVHRLDRTVGGLMVFARTKSAAAELCALAASDGIEKLYLAVAEGSVAGGEYRDYIYKDARLSKAFVVDSARRGVKEALLDCEPLVTHSERTLCKISLHTGRYHQIRVQMSSRGTPLVGDGKYGSRDKGARVPSLMAYSLAFSLGGKRISASVLPDASVYPWCLFEKELSLKEF